MQTNLQPVNPADAQHRASPLPNIGGNTRYCKDCKHSISPAHMRGMRCAHPEQGFDLVYGRPVLPACELLRQDLPRLKIGSGQCGPQGRHFEPAARLLAQPPIEPFGNGTQGV